MAICFRFVSKLWFTNTDNNGHTFFCYWYNLNHIPLISNISQKRADLYFQRLSNITTNSDCLFFLLSCFSMNHGTNLCLIAFSKKKKKTYFWFKVYYSWKWVWLVFVCATLYINWPIFCIMFCRVCKYMYIYSLFTCTCFFLKCHICNVPKVICIFHTPNFSCKYTLSQSI